MNTQPVPGGRSLLLCSLALLLVILACTSRVGQSDKAKSGNQTDARNNPAHGDRQRSDPSGPKMPQTGEQLLDESEKLAAQLEGTPLERADYLAELCTISVKTAFPKSEQRCLRSFHVAGGELGGCKGEKLQVKSVVSLSYVNPELAMRLLSEIKPWCGRSDDPYPDDAGEQDER
jgi:hypothetical protein